MFHRQEVIKHQFSLHHPLDAWAVLNETLPVNALSLIGMCHLYSLKASSLWLPLTLDVKGLKSCLHPVSSGSVSIQE